jgi:hypothetical protein
MDFDTVKKTLLDGNYPDMSSFLADLKLVCENAKTYFGPDTVMTIMSDEILQYIERQEKLVDLSAEQIWYNRLVQIQTRLEQHLKNMPPGLSLCDGVK